MVVKVKLWNRIFPVLLLCLLLFTGCSSKASQDPVIPADNEPQITDPVKEEPEVAETPAEPVETETGVKETEIEPVDMYTTEAVNARTGQGVSFEVRYTLPRGTKVQVLESKDGWSRILHEEEISYIAEEFLSLSIPVERKRIVIDAGHQSKGNSTREPNAPGSSVTKAKVSSGTRGVSTGLYEYELNLLVTMKLREELIQRGYEVILVREKHDVDISNVERAMVANDNEADCFIRIHANGDSNSKTRGMLTISQTSANPDNGHLHPESYRLSRLVLSGMVEETGAADRGIWETDTMTGINWCKVPSTIVEMGFMSNPEEDVLLSTDAYQDKIVQGIANGLDDYFSSGAD